MSRMVIDTNVFVHSCNPANNLFAEAVAFIENIRSGSTTVCVDEGLNINEAQNRSRIWSEYIEHVPAMSLAGELLAELLVNDRVFDVPTRVPQTVANLINQLVRDNSDRIFVKVSINSESAYLVSHDHAAFPRATRRALRKAGIANVVDCDEVSFAG